MRLLPLTGNPSPETNAAATQGCERAVEWREWGHAIAMLNIWTLRDTFDEDRPHYEEWLKNRMEARTGCFGIGIARRAAGPLA